MLSPKKFSHLREPLMLTPTPGIITRISSKALVANKSSVTLGRRKKRYGTRESVTQAAAPSATPISCFLTGGKRVVCRRFLIIGGAEQGDQPHQEQQHHQHDHRLVAGSLNSVRHGSLPSDCTLLLSHASFAAGRQLIASP